MAQQIILRKLEKPREKQLQEDLYWMCNSFGFHAGRDLEQVAVRIITDVLQHLSAASQVSSERIADDLTMSHARVNHHLRNLIDAGFLYREKRLIFMRGGSVKNAVTELRKDANRIFDELEMMADEIDEAVGLKSR